MSTRTVDPLPVQLLRSQVRACVPTYRIRTEDIEIFLVLVSRIRGYRVEFLPVHAVRHPVPRDLAAPIPYPPKTGQKQPSLPRPNARDEGAVIGIPIRRIRRLVTHDCS